jgi:hypothetical protein
LQIHSGASDLTPVRSPLAGYALHNRIERFFNKLKNARRVATRCDKTAVSFLAFIQLASIKIWLRFDNRT